MKKLLIFFIFLLLLATKLNVTAYNGVPYKTYTEDSNGRLIETQDAYIPINVLNSFRMIEDDEEVTYSLNAPEDIFIDGQNNIYIADTGNKRILVIEPGLKNIRVIGEDLLSRPTGVYVCEDGYIYVADYEKQSVYKFNQNNEVVHTYTRPNHPLYGRDHVFRPGKITLDRRGNLYIVDVGNPNGIIQLSQTGEFLGYFGTNYIQPSLRTIIQFMFYTKEQRASLYKLPPAPNNLVTDHEGLINTITRNVNGNAIKKMNISGHNLLPENMTDDARLIDLAIGPIGNIYAISEAGFIYEYDMEGNLLFRFGGSDLTGLKKGMFSIPSAITVDEHSNLYVLDRASSMLHVFIPTEFANLVHEAIYYFQEGLYIESHEPWKEVLKMNNMFDLAHLGIGKAYFQDQMYEEALFHFQIANAKSEYSEAYWQIRNEWLMSYVVWIFGGIALFFIFFKLTKLFGWLDHIKEPFGKLKNKLFQFKIIRELAFLNYFKKHPVDGFYGIKREEKSSYITATILYFLYYVITVLSMIYTGFVFNHYELHTLSLFKVATNHIGPLLVFVVTNYLVSSINDGEGKFKDIYISTIYCFMPLIMYWPIVIILSNFLTLNEAFIYQAAMYILWAWTIILLYLMIKEIHNYSFKETNKNIIITLFTMLIFIAGGFIFYILLYQVYEFAKEVVIEVIANA